MVNDTLTFEQALERGLVSTGRNTTISSEARILPFEDNGRSSGPIVIGDNVRIRAGVILCSGIVIGNDVTIGHQCVVRARVRIGHSSMVSHFVCLERDAQVGRDVRISALTHITGGCLIDDEVQIGARVVTVNDNEMRWKSGEVLCAPRILRGAKIGSGCTLLGHVTIGEYSFVGAGSVVTRDIPANRLAYGNPAYVQGEAPAKEWRAGASKPSGVHREE
jgi:acetyltransferase-like isoleucine patch superfamily enzyme